MDRQKNAVFVCELGGGLGHIAPLTEIALQLAQKNYSITFILPALEQAKFIQSSGLNFKLIQAPNHYFEATTANLEPGTYSEILLLSGYTQSDRLELGIKAWRDLFAAIEPDAIIFDFAPTAQLAARSLNLKRFISGYAYTIPPFYAPLPAFQATLEANRAQSADEFVLKSVNSVLERLSIPKLAQVCDIFESDELFIQGFSEIDCYADRRPEARYCGPIFSSFGKQTSPTWSGEAPKVFAYFNTQFPFLEPLIKYLGKRFDCNISLRGQASKNFTSLSSDACKIYDKPIDSIQAISSCDWVFCHGSFNTVAQSLAKRKNICAIPLQTEQKVIAELLQKNKLGIYLPPVQSWAEFEKNLENQLLGSPEYLRISHKEQLPSQQLIAESIDNIVSQPV